MKDEVIELLEPERLTKYRRWRPLLTALIVVATVFAIVGQALVLFDGGHTRSEVDKATYFLAASSFFWAIQVFADKVLTRSVSLAGSQFSTPLRRYLTAAWVVASVTGYATLYTIG